LDHPGKLAEESIALLAGLMRRGRSVLYVAAERVDATNLKRLAEAVGSGLQMPVEFSPPLSGQVRRDLFIAEVRRDDVPFHVFGDQRTAVTRQLRFGGGLGSRRLVGGIMDDVLATYGDGTACMVLTAADAGSLAVINADLGASNLPKTPAFVPIVDQLVGAMLDRDRATRPAGCGEPLVVRLPTEITSSQGLEISASPGASGPFGTLLDEPTGVVWQWPAAGPPGVYEVRRGGSPLFALAVQIPADESDLESLPPRVLQDRLAAGRPAYVRSAFGEASPRDDVWSDCLTACLVCLLGSIVVLLVSRT
jgi:hypothetical protein